MVECCGIVSNSRMLSNGGMVPSSGICCQMLSHGGMVSNG